MRTMLGWLLLLFGTALLATGIAGGVGGLFTGSGRTMVANVGVVVGTIAALVAGIAILSVSRRKLEWRPVAFGSVSTTMVILMLALVAAAVIRTSVRTTKQKRTIGDMISLAAAIEAYSVDFSGYPAVSSVEELATQLDPKFMTTVPRFDSWQHELRYERVVAADGKETFYLGSAGGDGAWEHAHLSDYAAGATTGYDDDIIWKDQALIRYPRSLAWLANARAPAGR